MKESAIPNPGEERDLETRYDEASGALLGRVEGGEWDVLDPHGVANSERARSVSLLLAAAGEGVKLTDEGRRSRLSIRDIAQDVRREAARLVVRMQDAGNLTIDEAAEMHRYINS